MVNPENIRKALATNKERGGNYSVIEKYAIDVLYGKQEASPKQKELLIKYMIHLDITRRKQKMNISIMKMKSKTQNKKQQAEKPPAVPEQNESPSTITSELQKRILDYEQNEVH